MKNNIKFGISALLVAMLLVSMVFVPAVSGKTIHEEKDIELVEDPQIELKLELEPVTEPTTEKSPYWYLLEADKDEQKTLFKYIDNCYVSAQEKKDMKTAMKDIWKTYPSQLTEENNIMLEKVAIETSEYLNDKYGNDDIGVRWLATPHKDMAYIAATKDGVGTVYATYAKNAADDPDEWSDSEIWQSLHHYYDPLTQTGLAPYNCNAYAQTAKNQYDIPNFLNAYTNLGYSLHYMSDLGNPLHTGLEAQQALNKWVHTGYESYISNNWNSGYNFKSIVESTNSYFSVTNPSTSAKNLASHSNSHIYSLYADIFYNPDTWQTDQDIVTTTDNVLLYTAKYNLGLVKYVRS